MSAARARSQTHLGRLTELARGQPANEVDRLGEQRRDAGAEADARAATGDSQMLEADAEGALLPASVALLLDEQLDHRLEAERVAVGVGFGGKVVRLERPGACETADEIAHGLGIEVLRASDRLRGRALYLALLHRRHTLRCLRSSAIVLALRRRRRRVGGSSCDSSGSVIVAPARERWRQPSLRHGRADDRRASSTTDQPVRGCDLGRGSTDDCDPDTVHSCLSEPKRTWSSAAICGPRGRAPVQGRLG